MPKLDRRKELWFSHKPKNVWFSHKPKNVWSPNKIQVIVEEVLGSEFYNLWIYINRRKFKGHQFTGINAEKMAKQAARKVWKDLVE